MFFQRSAIKIDIAFAVIREINEILSLTNEPEKLVNTALDTLSQTLNIECCWIQTISDRQNQTLSLAADRGFSDAMRAEIASMDLKHKFSGEIIGMGNKITIPNMNHDGVYGLSSFREEGYRWLVAAPLMTYRAYGLLGAACRNKKSYDKNTAGLIMVLAGLIANALSKAELTRNFQTSGKPVTPSTTNLDAARVTEAPLLARMVKKPNKTTLPPLITTPPRGTPPENKDDDDVLARLLKMKRTLSAPRPLTPPVIPAEEITDKAPPNPLKTSYASDSPLRPPPVTRPQKPTDPAFSPHPRQIPSYREAHRKS